MYQPHRHHKKNQHQHNFKLLIIVAFLLNDQVLADEQHDEHGVHTPSQASALPFKVLTPVASTSSLLTYIEQYRQQYLTLKQVQKSKTKPPYLLLEPYLEAYFFAGKKLSGRADDFIQAEGNVEFRHQSTAVYADQINYTALDDLLQARGEIRYLGNDGEVSGKSLDYQVSSGSGTLYSANYQYVPNSSMGQISNPSKTENINTASNNSHKNKDASERYAYAEKLKIEGDGRYQLFSGYMTSCRPDKVDWYIKADLINLDYQLDRGNSEKNTLYFKDLPIISVPNFWFPLSANTRHSGFLSPTFGITSTARDNTSNQAGVDITIPYYWNIAPNYDLTFLPRLMQSRGLQLGGLYRYLQTNYNGEIKGEWLPQDRVAKISRGAIKISHNHKLFDNLSAEFLWQEVSDDKYFTDLTSRISETTQTNLPRSIKFSYNPNSWWDASVLIQRYQTLNPNEASVINQPYRLAPEFNFNARKLDVQGADLELTAQSTNYLHPSNVDGQRNVLSAQASYPLNTAAFFIKPNVKIHAASYHLNQQQQIIERNQQYLIPIFSVDSGLHFTKNTNFFAEDYVQTLEPRLFYTYIPYRNQQQAPLFDSAYSDFNFAQMFTENRFSGKDRIGDANQLTAALTSRLQNMANGSEYLRAAIGARYAFVQNRVKLSDEQTITQGSTNILAAITSKILPKSNLDAALEYDPNGKFMQRFSLGGRYQPSPGKTLNLSYRLQRDALKQIDLSLQWPFADNWSVVGRYNYSIRDKVTLESLMGFEYQAGCWAARMVAHRLQTASGKPSVNYFFQIELGDLGRIGSSPIQLLKRSISGYQSENFGWSNDNQDAADKLANDLAW